VIGALALWGLMALPERGEVVFLQRERDVNVIMVASLGGTPKKVFRNADASNPNCLHPRWTADGARIEFVAMKNGAWARWSMSPDGSDAHPIDGVPDLVSRDVRSPELEVRRGKGKQILFRVDTKTELFSMRPLADGDGVGEATLNADKSAVAFQSCQFGVGCKLMVVSGDGKTSKALATGTDPDWRPAR